MNPLVKSFFHHDTYTWTHLVICKTTNIAVLIDPVLDYNANNANTSTEFTDTILSHINKKNITLKYILETHVHADHLTSATYIKEKLNAKTIIGQEVIGIQKVFKKIFNLGAEFETNASQFSMTIADNEIVYFGDCELIALSTPGHTNDSMSYKVGKCVFIGDTLFSPDYGSARCDFPGGDASKLFDSVQKLFKLGDNKKLYLCHDYPPSSREPKPWFLSKDQQLDNIHLNSKISKSQFIKIRNKRDKALNQPRLIIPSIQVNMSAGEFPKPDTNGIVYLKIPINTLGL